MLESLLVTIIIGALAGRLWSQIWQNHSLGLLWNIVLGIIGSYVGSRLFGVLGISLWAGYVGMILTGAIWAIVILALVNLIYKWDRVR